MSYGFCNVFFCCYQTLSSIKRLLKKQSEFTEKRIKFLLFLLLVAATTQEINILHKKMKKTLILLVFGMIANNGFSQTTTYSQDYQGNTVAKDQYGNIQSTYSQDYQGNTVKKDEYGNTQGTYSEDYQGNTIYTPAPPNR